MFKGPRETLGTNDDRAAHASSCHPGLFTFSDIFPFSEENIDGICASNLFRRGRQGRRRPTPLAQSAWLSLTRMSRWRFECCFGSQVARWSQVEWARWSEQCGVKSGGQVELGGQVEWARWPGEARWSQVEWMGVLQVVLPGCPGGILHACHPPCILQWLSGFVTFVSSSFLSSSW